MSSPSFQYYQTITYTACDQDVYQQDIIIHRTTGENYEERVGYLNIWHIFVGTKCKEDYGDVRFINSDGVALIYYLWPDYTTEIAHFCVRLCNAMIAGSVTICYGNPAADAISDDNAYIIFDHFDGSSLNADIWQNNGRTVGTGTFSVSVANSALRISASASSGGRVESKREFQLPIMMEVRWRVASPEAQNTIFDVASRNLVRMIYSGNNFCYQTRIGNDDDPFQTREKFVRSPPSVYTLSQMIVTPNSFRYLENGKVVNTVQLQDILTLGQTLRYRTGGYDGASVYYDWILIRNYSAVPPSVITFSGEQTNSNIHRQSVSFGSDSLMVI